MSNTSSAFGTLAASRFQAMQAGHTTEQKTAEGKDNNSIELPEAIKQLITGTDFWVKAKTNRYKKLIREGHLSDLLELAKLAPQMAIKAEPSHWFAAACSVKYWEKRTLDFLKKLHALYSLAAQVMARISVGVDIAEKMQKFVYKQIWLRRSVERHAAAAQEIKHDKLNQSSAKLFAWLCQQEGRQAA